MPTGGGVISTLSGLLGSQLQKHEYNRYQNRMAVVTDVGTIEELTDVARRIARQLADRYQNQLLSLILRPDEVPQACLSSCPCFSRKNNANSSTVQPWNQIAQFGVAFTVQGILDGKIDNEQFSDDTKCEDLAKVITQLICSAKPTMKAKVRRRLNLIENAILPYTPFDNRKENEILDQWYLHEFYEKPGIYIMDGEELIKQKKLSWMNPDLYSYRLGTAEEYASLEKLDEKKVEKKNKRCCC
jgi:hypothetical protein